MEKRPADDSGVPHENPPSAVWAGPVRMDRAPLAATHRKGRPPQVVTRSR